MPEDETVQLKAQRYLLAEFISRHDIDEELCKRITCRKDPFIDDNRTCIECIIDNIGYRKKERD